jgi:sugar phosphate permease
VTNQRRVLTLLWIEFFTAYLDRTNIAVAGPTLMKTLAITPQLFGYVLAAFTAGYAVMQVPGGILADRFGVRRVLVAALLVWSLFTGLTALAASVGALILVRFCFGLGEGIESGAHFRALGDTFTSRERSTASGILHTSLALGPAVAAPLAAAIIGAYGWQALFLWFTVPGIIVAAVVWRYFPKTTGQPRPPQATMRALQRGPRLWWMFAAYLCFNVAFWGLAGWMPSYLSSERHIELKSLGFAASVPYLFGFAGLLVLGWVARTLLYERRAQLVAGAYVLAGLSLFLAFRAGDVVPEGSHGALSGFVNLGGQIGGFFAPIAVGAFVGATHSYAGGFALMACALIAGAGAVLCAQGALHEVRSVTPAITNVQ